MNASACNARIYITIIPHSHGLYENSQGRG